MNLSGLCRLVMSGDHDKFFVDNQSSQTTYEEFSAEKTVKLEYESQRIGLLQNPV